MQKYYNKILKQTVITAVISELNVTLAGGKRIYALLPLASKVKDTLCYEGEVK